jgi:hypothetical protein
MNAVGSLARRLYLELEKMQVEMLGTKSGDKK